jgi:ribonuclease Z
VELSVFFLGTGGSVPSARRGLPATLVLRGGERLLFDCGEGTQRQMLRSVGLVDLDAVFLTHLHADHWLGLPGMLKSFALRDRAAPLAVYGPRGLRELMAAMRIVYGTRLPYELSIVELEPWEELDRDGYRVAAVPVNHGARNAQAYAVLEDGRPGEFDPDRATRLGIEPGPDFGRLQRGETVAGVRPDQVMGEPRRGRKLVFSGDTAPAQTLAVAAHGADVLVHEATFAEEEAERARDTFHSTARQAAEIGREADVAMLVLNHVSSRYSGAEIRDQARAVFAATEVPKDFDAVEVPFPERGTPRLHRADARREARRDGVAGEATEGRTRTEPIVAP